MVLFRSVPHAGGMTDVDRTAGTKTFITDSTRQRRRHTWNGVALLLLSPFVGFFFLVLGVLTANPCGMFADGCDDSGQTTGFSSLMFLFMLVSFIGMIGLGLAQFMLAQAKQSTR